MEKWRSETTEKSSRDKVVKMIEKWWNKHREGLISEEELMERMLEDAMGIVYRNGFEKGFEKGKRAASLRKSRQKKAPPQRRRCYKCGVYGHQAASCNEPDKSDIKTDTYSAAVCDMEEKIKKLDKKIEGLGSKLDSVLKVSEDSKPSEMEKSEPKTSLSREETLKSEMMEWSMEKWRPFQIEPSIPFANNEIVNYRDPKFSMFRTSWEDKRIRFGPFMWKLW